MLALREPGLKRFCQNELQEAVNLPQASLGRTVKRQLPRPVSMRSFRSIAEPRSCQATSAALRTSVANPADPLGRVRLAREMAFLLRAGWLENVLASVGVLPGILAECVGVVPERLDRR